MTTQEGQNWSQSAVLDAENVDQDPSNIEENNNPESYYEENIYQKLIRPCNRYDESMGKFIAKGTLPPPCLAQYVVKEDKVSSPRFLRFSSINCLLNQNSQYYIGIPVGAIWQPLAEILPDDDKIPLIEREPIRCTNCLAYMNPHFKFSNIDFKCNICGHIQVFPKEYFKSQDSFPEFRRGTYEYLISKEIKGDQYIYYFVCIDITNFSLGLGVYQQALSSIKDILNYIPNPEIVKIGIMTYDSFLHFFTINNSENVQEIIVSDIDDLFIPFHFSELCHNAYSEREKIEKIIESLLNWEFSEIKKNILPTTTIINLVKNYFNGDAACRLLLFSSNPENFKTENSMPFSSTEECIRLGKECTDNALCVDLFLFNSRYGDISSLSKLSSQTGGDIYYYTKFLLKYDGEKLYYQLLRIFTRPQVFDVNMRIRCSIKMTIDDCIGNFVKRSPVEMQMAAIDCDKSIGILLKYDGVLAEKKKIYLQCVILYRNNLGQKILRIFNGFIVAKEFSKFIHTEYGDLDTINNILVKKYSKMMFEKQLQAIKSDWYNFIYLVTNNYAFINNSDVIKPHFIDMLPLYYNTANKLPGLSYTQSLTDDFRVVSLYSLLSISSSKLRLLLYPNIYKLHDILDQPHLPGTESGLNTIYLPEIISCKKDSLSSNGVYLLANGEILVVFIGKNASEEFLIKLFGKKFEELSREDIDIKNIGTEESERISVIINEIRIKNPNGIPPLYFYLDGKDNYELIKQFMVEEQNENETSYELFVECLNCNFESYDD